MTLTPSRDPWHCTWATIGPTVWPAPGTRGRATAGCAGCARTSCLGVCGSLSPGPARRTIPTDPSALTPSTGTHGNAPLNVRAHSHRHKTEAKAEHWTKDEVKVKIFCDLCYFSILDPFRLVFDTFPLWFPFLVTVTGFSSQWNKYGAILYL